MTGSNVLFGTYSPLARGYAGEGNLIEPTRKFIWYSGMKGRLKHVNGLDFGMDQVYSFIQSFDWGYSLSDHEKNAIDHAPYPDLDICVLPLRDVIGRGRLALLNSGIVVGAKMDKTRYTTESGGDVGYFYGNFEKRGRHEPKVINIGKETNSGIIVPETLFKAVAGNK